MSVPAAEHLAEELAALHSLLREQLEQVKDAYKREADKHRKQGKEIRVGDQV